MASRHSLSCRKGSSELIETIRIVDCEVVSAEMLLGVVEIIAISLGTWVDKNLVCFGVNSTLLCKSKLVLPFLRNEIRRREGASATFVLPGAQNEEKIEIR